MGIRPADPTKKLVVIEESMLMSMAHNQKFLQDFPFLRGLQKLATRKTGCGRCGKTNQAKATALTSAKQTLASMSSGQKAKLKKLLNTEKIRITFRTSGGKVSNSTF